MKKTALFLASFLFTYFLFAQEITNIVLLTDKGITDNAKKATGAVVVKKMPDGSFQRNDYTMRGPLKAVKTYTNADMKILSGFSATYSASGYIAEFGNYTNNKKDGNWYRCNDKGKVILKEIYENDSLLRKLPVDEPEEGEKDELEPGEKDPAFPGGLVGLRNYIVQTINVDVGLQSKKGGTVRVAFTITESGNITEIYLRKSVEFVLDEEALRVVHRMPDWEPAEKDGRKVNAYRIQPLTFAIQ